MVKTTGLGKGLDALLGNLNLADINDNSLQIKQINLSKIKPNTYQPRTQFSSEELQQLADSIKNNGVISPIILRRINDGYEIIAGERRYRASALAGLTQIPAIIREVTNQEALALALIENIQRADLSIIEEANGYNRLVNEFHFKHADIAAIANKSRAHITNLLRLLNLSSNLQQMLISKQLTMGHARALLPLNQEQQLAVANKVTEQGLTTRQTEKLVNNILHPNFRETSNTSTNLEIKQIQLSLNKKFGLNTKIKSQQDGSGKLIISYNSLEQLKQLLV